MSLEVHFLCASRGHGTSSKSGTPKPYQFAYVEYLSPAEDYIKGDHHIQKFGFDKQQISMTDNPQMFDKFKAFRPLEKVNLVLSADPSNPTRNIVTDVKEVKA